MYYYIYIIYIIHYFPWKRPQLKLARKTDLLLTSFPIFTVNMENGSYLIGQFSQLISTVAVFQGNLFSFENQSDLQTIYLTSLRGYEPLRQHCIGFFSCVKLSQDRSIKTAFHRIFSCAMLSGVCQTTGFCIGFWPVRCCPKSIKTTLNRISSCALLSGASRTALHKVFTCVILSQWY